MPVWLSSMKADNDRVVKRWAILPLSRCALYPNHSSFCDRPVSSSDVFTGGIDSLIGRAADAELLYDRSAFIDNILFNIWQQTH